MFVRFHLLAIAALLLAGCLPESKNPISSPAETFNDPRLEGLWEYRAEDGSRTYYHIRWHSEGDAKWLDIVGVAHRVKNGLDAGGYRALPARIGANTFLSFKEVSLSDRANQGRNYSFARYDFNWRGDLRIRLAGESALAAAIRSGALRGKLTETRFGTDVRITDSSARIAGFLGRTDADAVFDGDPMLFRKVRGR